MVGANTQKLVSDTAGTQAAYTKVTAVNAADKQAAAGTVAYTKITAVNAANTKAAVSTAAYTQTAGGRGVQTLSSEASGSGSGRQAL